MTRRRPIARSWACCIACSLCAAAPAGGTSPGGLPSGDEGRFGKWIAIAPPRATIVPDAAAAPDAASPAANRPLRLSSPFGFRLDPINHSIAFHPGIDLPGPRGAAVFASADGAVVWAGWRGGYGKLVEIDHGRGLRSLYGHLDEILVPAGASVHRGALIGRVGSTGRTTGPHLHFEVRIDGASIDPLPLLTAPAGPGDPAPAATARAITIQAAPIRAATVAIAARPSWSAAGGLPQPVIGAP